MNKKGFTLIELLVVISIIALLSSIVITGTNIAKAKGRDAKKLAEINSVKTAITSYIIDHGTPPPNYNCDGGCVAAVVSTQRATLEMEDMSNPASPVSEPGKAYRATMNDLVVGGYLAGIPQSTGGAPYYYYDYGPGSSGAIFGTILETAPLTTTGTGNSCRPNGQSLASANTEKNSSLAATQLAFGFPAQIPEDRTHGGTYCPDPATNPNADVCGVWVPCSANAQRYHDCGVGPASCPNGPGWDLACPYVRVLTTANLCDNNPTADYCSCNPY